jgi:hypothetical protein
VATGANQRGRNADAISFKHVHVPVRPVSDWDRNADAISFKDVHVPVRPVSDCVPVQEKSSRAGFRLLRETSCAVVSVPLSVSANTEDCAERLGSHSIGLARTRAGQEFA